MNGDFTPVMRVRRRIRLALLRIFGYRPRLFWDFWAIDFDREKDKVTLEQSNVEALRLVQESKPSSILEVGCGFGRNLRELLKSFRAEQLYGVDISSVMLSKCKRYLGNVPVHLRRADATRLPFEASSVDSILLSFVLMHIAPERVLLAIQEAIRVARKRVVFAELCVPQTLAGGSHAVDRYTFSHDYKFYVAELKYEIMAWTAIDKWCVFCVDKPVRSL